MMLHSYPLLISIYKGEGRMLIVPLIDHIAGYSIDSDWFINLSDLDNAVSVGEGVKSALDYIRNEIGKSVFDGGIIMCGMTTDL